MRLFLFGCIFLILLGACEAADDRDDGARQPTPAPQATGSPTETASPEKGEQLASCENPEGFTIPRPESWHTNPGEVVPPCSQFDPEPFEVPEATDERVAAIAAYIDPVPFEQVSEPTDRRDADRTEVTISGFEAVRLEYEAGSETLWPEGTPITMYMIDIPPGPHGDRTLFVDTIGLEPFDYGRNQDVLDRIAPDIEWTG